MLFKLLATSVLLTMWQLYYYNPRS